MQRGPGGPEALQPAVNTKNETNVPELYVKLITQHPVLCAGGSSRTNCSRYPPPQRTPRPSRVASTGFINFSMAFLPSLKWSLFKIIFRHELFIVLIEPQVLHQLLNVSKGDVPMALLPDPTTAASERSSVKNRLTGSRRRGSGINRHRSRTISKTSLRGCRRTQGGCRARASATSRKTRKIRQTFRSCLSSLTRSCIQDCVHSAHAAAFPGGFNRLHQLLHGFFTKF